MSDVIITAPDESFTITTGGPSPVEIVSGQTTVEIDAGGMIGPEGPPGPTGPAGTTVVPVPYGQWPPADPQPNTLYLRLAP